MSFVEYLYLGLALGPAVLMGMVSFFLMSRPQGSATFWKPLQVISAIALLCALAQLVIQWAYPDPTNSNELIGWDEWLSIGKQSAWMALLVQFLGTVIGAFSSRYLQGEKNQNAYAAAFSGVLASVHILLLAGHWAILILAWAAVGVLLRHLLCFYKDRPFARLAAHKKNIADRLADGLLLMAATCAWVEVGSGNFADLWTYIELKGATTLIQLSAISFVLAVILRTALFPVHGWLIQVMEAPTPVSALLHAGVVNLGGYLLIRFAPLLEAVPAARWILIAFGLGTAVFAGFVMLTRISIKVRLAWSTVAQMGFMLLECGLGLYTLAALHLIGHSLYKAHAFLSASSVVRDTKFQIMRGRTEVTGFSLLLAPVCALAIVITVQALIHQGSWPWWWSSVLALVWAPLLWMPPVNSHVASISWRRGLFGAGLLAVLTAVVTLAHSLPLGVQDAPFEVGGPIAVAGVTLLYLGIAMLQWRPACFMTWRRWSYAGFYVDEFYTRFAIRHWRTRWTTADPRPVP